MLNIQDLYFLIIPTIAIITDEIKLLNILFVFAALIIISFWCYIQITKKGILFNFFNLFYDISKEMLIFLIYNHTENTELA